MELFVDYVEGSADPSADVEPLVTPSIIPRFVPSCSSELMHGLGAISSTRGRKGQKMPVHSHLSESVAEIEWVKSLHPDCETYAGGNYLGAV